MDDHDALYLMIAFSLVALGSISTTIGMLIYWSLQ